MRKEGDADLLEGADGLLERRRALQEFAGLRIEAAVPVDDGELGLFEVFVRALRFDQIAAAQIVGAVLGSDLRRRQARAKLVPRDLSDTQSDVCSAVGRERDPHGLAAFLCVL